MVAEKEHLTPNGLEEIMKLRERLNEGRGRTRKYSLQDYQDFCMRESSETNTLDSAMMAEKIESDLTGDREPRIISTGGS